MPTDRKAPATPMSSATAVDATPVPAKKGRKKLIIIAAAAALVLVLGGGAAVFILKKKAADAVEGEDAAQVDGHAATAAKHADKGTPVFVPLEQFTVNLADRDAERFAQVGVTLELEDAKAGDKIKAYMPAIRNNILLAIADKTAPQLLDRDGKRRLASEIRRETLRVLGVEVPDDEGSPDATKTAKAKKKDADEALPVRAVHFSNFIIQ